ncbi:hypothetical protein, partial [Shewanella putrefaciens]|uniref:hypothetical protein n=1 Tax=Shewanella putrefaciens TaxID=24 RepID=UPI003562576D
MISLSKNKLFPKTLLLLSAFIALPVLATDARDLSPGAIDPPPQSTAVDSRGVDMISGTTKVAGMRVSIGSDSSRLVSDPGMNRFNRDNNVGTLTRFSINSVHTGGDHPAHYFGLPIGTYYKVDIAGISEVLDRTTGLSASGDGGKISCTTATCTYTSKDGLVAVFDLSLNNKEGERNAGIVSSLTKPDGEQLTFDYQKPAGDTQGAASPTSSTKSGMPRAVLSSLGWQLNYFYSDVVYENLQNASGSRSITAMNRTQEYCDPTLRECSYTFDWPTSSMTLHNYIWVPNDNPSGAYSFTDKTQVYQPGALKPDYHEMVYGLTLEQQRQNYISPEGVETNTLIAGYTNYYAEFGGWIGPSKEVLNKITSIKTAGLTGDYNFSSPSSRTGPDGAYDVDKNYRRLNSFTDKLNRKTSYSYQGNYKNRITRIDFPDNHYETFTYDANGNILTHSIYPSSATNPITTTATYWTCDSSNQKYCNKPKTVTNQNGKVTSYTYSATHGGVLTVTKPSVTVNGTSVTPVVNYTYTQYTPYSKNSSGGWQAASQGVYRVTKIAQCRTASSCSGSANEQVKIVSYDPYNNLLPNYEIVRAGNGTL